MNVITSLLENPLNERGMAIGYCLFKTVLQMGESLKAHLKDENLEKAPFSKKLEKIDLFKDSHEFKSFVNVFSKEFIQINGCLVCFKEDLKIDNQHFLELNENKRFLLENLYNYSEEIKEKLVSLASEGKNEEMRQMLVLGNELVDCLNIEEFFEKNISENSKFSDQKYFEDLKRGSLSDLNQSFTNKIDHLHDLLRV